MTNEIELVDLVDRSGVIKKQGVPRPEADGLPDLYLQIVVAIILNKNGDILTEKRSDSLEVDPKCIDTVCGAISSGETPEQAAKRESIEETGINPKNLKVVAKGVNKYGRFRILVVGESDEEPKQTDPTEVEWSKFIPMEELQKKYASGEYKFVGDFWEDLDTALKYQVSTSPLNVSKSV